jgi:hypothetical protein
MSRLAREVSFGSNQLHGRPAGWLALIFYRCAPPPSCGARLMVDSSLPVNVQYGADETPPPLPPTR